jgi:hypothetical protein
MFCVHIVETAQQGQEVWSMNARPKAKGAFARKQYCSYFAKDAKYIFNKNKT